MNEVVRLLKLSVRLYFEIVSEVFVSVNRMPNSSKQEKQEVRAIVISALFLAAGCIVLWFAKTVLGIQGDAVLISLLIIPVLIYVIVSGKLEEFKAPGGVEAKFVKVANESVSAASETVKPSREDMQIVLKSSSALLEKKREELNESQPIVMIMELGKGGYGREMALGYLEVLSQFRNFKFVVFVDINKRFLGYMPSWAVKSLLSKHELGEEFIDVINTGKFSELFRYPGVVTETISTQWTNVEALREMTRRNLEALVVIDENKQLVGVVEREQILSKMMLSLVK